ncbi:MAG: (2Fe-2S)-binding protein [Chloroflexota bacterium]|nr:(2Fe-2S)-binding protein [Chloroflexota bacterium]
MSVIDETSTDVATVTVRLSINGGERLLDVDPAETLLTTLRERLGCLSMRGTCFIGVCGVCTVLVDGLPISGCLALTALHEGKTITTAEGLLDANGQPDEVQAAFIEHSAFQCSFCTPAMVLASTSLLAERPDPTRAEIREYLAGNLCRCGSYPNVVDAIRALARRRREAARPDGPRPADTGGDTGDTDG